MRGHIRERSSGHWAIVLEVRDPLTGKRKRKWHRFRGTKRGAQTECARLIAEMQGRAYLDPGKITVAEFLDRWLDHMRTQVSHRTHECYGEVVRHNLTPALGQVILSKLRPVEIAKAYADALASGRRRRGGGLSPNSVKMMHRALSQALKQAVRWQLLPSNPAAAVKPPRVERKQMQVLDADGTAMLIEALRGRCIFVPVLLGVLTGMRRGEVAALRWRCVDLDRRQITVTAAIEQTKAGLREKQPKSGHGRTVAVPEVLVEELRRHQVQQAQDMLRLGIRVTGDKHVCLQEDGQPWPPSILTDRFRRFIRSSKMPRIRLHDLRHSHATQLLAENVHPKIVQERLGHADITTTINLYSHVLPGMQSEAADLINVAVRTAMAKQRRK